MFTNCEAADKVHWRGIRTNLIFDVDGTFAGTNVPTYITPYYRHFDKIVTDGKCTHETDLWNNSVVCTGTRLRPAMFRNFEKKEDF